MTRAILLYLILGLHLAGIFFRLYWTIPNYDTFTHLLGGFWVAMMAAYVVDRYASHVKLTGIVRALFLIGIAAAVGIGWEWYEFLADTFIFHRHWIQDTVADTMFDLGADVVGAAAYALVDSVKFLK